MEKIYLTVEEACELTRYQRRTLYNKISMGVFREGEHYVKPSRRRVLFVRTALEDWLRGPLDSGRQTEPGSLRRTSGEVDSNRDPQESESPPESKPNAPPRRKSNPPCGRIRI